MSDDILDLVKKVPVAGGAVEEAQKFRRRVRSHRRLPLPLYLAEFFLFVVIAVYFAKICVMCAGMASDIGGPRTTILVYVVDVIMMIATLDAVLGITSSKPSSWRKVMRSALLLFVFSLIGYVSGTGLSASSLVVMNPLLIAAICIPVGAIMFLRSVREYYVPLKQEMPPLSRWVKYMLFTQLFPARKYQLSYE